MAEAWGILGQIMASPINTDVTVYQVPSGKKASIRVLACNQAAAGTGDTTIRMRMRHSGAVDNPNQIFVFDEPLAGQDSYESVLLMLATGENIRAQAGTLNVSFQAVGVEADV
jgi:hypothetical protein